MLVGVGGPIAAGKSTLADALSHRLQGPVIDADRTRKRLAGVAEAHRLADAGAPAFRGAYSEDATARVYATLVDHARPALRSGRAVVLDASFRTQALRDVVRRAAAELGVPCGFVACHAPADVLRARLEARDRQPGVVSDARAPLLDAFLARYEAPTGPDHLAVDTSQPVDLDVVAAWAADLTP